MKAPGAVGQNPQCVQFVEPDLFTGRQLKGHRVGMLRVIELSMQSDGAEGGEGKGNAAEIQPGGKQMIPYFIKE